MSLLERIFEAHPPSQRAFKRLVQAGLDSAELEESLHRLYRAAVTRTTGSRKKAHGHVRKLNPSKAWSDLPQQCEGLAQRLRNISEWLSVAPRITEVAELRAALLPLDASLGIAADLFRRLLRQGVGLLIRRETYRDPLDDLEDDNQQVVLDYSRKPHLQSASHLLFGVYEAAGTGLRAPTKESLANPARNEAEKQAAEGCTGFHTSL